MSLGLYISVPFCRTKCSYCNFASDVFSRAVFERYVERVSADINHADETAEQMGGAFESPVDSIFLGGGTPTILDITQLERLFVTISQKFVVSERCRNHGRMRARHAVSGDDRGLATLRSEPRQPGSAVVRGYEAASVGRLHKRATVLDDIARLRAAGIENINIDLIAGLPHQTAESWEFSLAEAIASGVPHVSVYMLEVDDDSRLGRELMAGGTRYHAHFVPDDDLTADLYETACERLNAAGSAAVRDFKLRPRRTRVAPQSEVLDAPALSGFWRGCALHAVSARDKPGGSAVRFAGLAGRIRGRRAAQKNSSFVSRPRSRKLSFWDCA